MPKTKKRTPKEIAEAIDKLEKGFLLTDPEIAHREADSLLLEHSHKLVREAYMRLKDKCRWWAYA